jgi:hypothetical protein
MDTDAEGYRRLDHIYRHVDAAIARNVFLFPFQAALSSVRAATPTANAVDRN